MNVFSSPVATIIMRLRVLLSVAALTALACARSEDPDLLRSEAGQDPSPTVTSEKPDDRPAIAFLGTSLTAGYGLEDPDLAYPAIIQRMIDERGLEYRVVNAGVSGDTSAGGLSRLTWLLQEPLDVLVLELGANDGLRGQDLEAMRANLQEIIDRTRARYPDVRFVIAGMEAPPNLGRPYTEGFREVFRDLARANEATLIPFLLEGVAGLRELNQGDAIHPNREGHERVARNVWPALEDLLQAR